ncbi:5-oxoprolinase [Halobacteriales archaeon QS_4_62_28]|nr:MAG: 5-oxoprolinase [Halobacteriales archaeon QS_4_62_28]
MNGTLLGVDVGGTFTDVVVAADGTVTTAKVPTTTDQSEGVLDGIERACEQSGHSLSAVDRFRHGTTVAVNAMLEETGGETALVTTDGFGDVLAIGRQDRPSLYDLDARRPDPLVPPERRYELDERATPEGIERPVDPEEVRSVAAAIDAEAVAVAFLHAYADPSNERQATEVLRSELDAPVSASHEVIAEFREYERTATTVADAYLTPVVDDYLARLTERARDRALPAPRVMQANGGIADAETVRERAVTTIMSGPAAGVVGASAFEPDERAGLITFDMGGTSSDVSLVRGGEGERTTEADIGGRPVRIPMVDVRTVGAGGGSIAWVDAGGALRVGPQSAGADPGPACYGRGGTEPTVTDAALVVGYLGAETTLGEDLTLDRAAAETALADLAATAALDDAVDAARGIYRVANATMTRAIRGVTTERGHDPREFAVAAFGGAGPMHAAALADRLDVNSVVVPRASGVLSAFGLLAADESHDAVRTHRTTLDDADSTPVESLYEELSESVLTDASDAEAAVCQRQADLRYAGQSHELTVDVHGDFSPERLRERFHDAHDRARGYRLPEDPVELVNCRVTATISGTVPDVSFEGGDEPRTGAREVLFGHSWRETPVYDWGSLTPGQAVSGPAIVEGGESTVVCPPAWDLTVDDRGTLRLEGTDE